MEFGPNRGTVPVRSSKYLSTSDSPQVFLDFHRSQTDTIGTDFRGVGVVGPCIQCTGVRLLKFNQTSGCAPVPQNIKLHGRFVVSVQTNGSGFAIGTAQVRRQ